MFFEIKKKLMFIIYEESESSVIWDSVYDVVGRVDVDATGSKYFFQGLLDRYLFFDLNTFVATYAIS